jgi:LacI family transcriptional regulator
VTLVRSSLKDAGIALIAELSRQCDKNESPRGTLIPSSFRVAAGLDPASVDERLPMRRRNVIG